MKLAHWNGSLAQAKVRAGEIAARHGSGFVLEIHEADPETGAVEDFSAPEFYVADRDGVEAARDEFTSWRIVAEVTR